MPRLSTVVLDRASSDVRAIYAEFYLLMKFPAAPNFIKSQGHSASVAQGSWDLVRNVLVGGNFSRYDNELLFVAISHERQCQYCEAAHIACCRMLGADDKFLHSLVYDIEGMGDVKLRTFLLFGLQFARDPQNLTEEDFATMRQHGFDNADILETISMAGLGVYANIMADAIGMEPDAMFAEVAGSAAGA